VPLFRTTTGTAGYSTCAAPAVSDLGKKDEGGNNSALDPLDPLTPFGDLNVTVVRM
jgi:hypothetical protein